MVDIKHSFNTIKHPFNNPKLTYCSFCSGKGNYGQNEEGYILWCLSCKGSGVISKNSLREREDTIEKLGFLWNESVDDVLVWTMEDEEYLVSLGLL